MTAEEIQEMYENLYYFRKKCERLELQAKDDAQEIMILTERLKKVQDDYAKLLDKYQDMENVYDGLSDAYLQVLREENEDEADL